MAGAEGFRGFEGKLRAGNITVLCRFGANGRSWLKHEGDGKSPKGSMSLLSGYFRHDRLPRPRSMLPLAPLRGSEGWCDDPADRMYNQLVPAGYPANHEILRRDDRQYDVVIIADYNCLPRVRGRGSAIFFHLTSQERRGTEGCIAITPSDMRKILPLIGPATRLIVR